MLHTLHRLFGLTTGIPQPCAEPQAHPDLYHSNVIVDDKFKNLALTDWQGTCIVPWELVEFPLFLSTVSRAMDAAFNNDQNGQPKPADARLRWKERAEYVQMVKAAETAMNKDAALSRTLGTTDVQGLAHAIKVYTEPGKLSFYDKSWTCSGRASCVSRN
ncbi:hypothetical protein EPUS_05300 [Endocarpon pusillum Z07020]|uniref:Aminoglycoside phosphotransferase domain-containing protein n=1 Tax=Endocarpon pusillum (strain Z07020 / HMAS-L-300199) TaxID=1263415 RepID=U1GGL7_ENDPU|nr:uncharacterized protein EPUS_05300 [Endocarpon pusillum Z07020]ERF71248.1 hypothetical protein EPUS_05300 [Endocarpon pusillum Z07020]